MPWNMYINVKI